MFLIPFITAFSNYFFAGGGIESSLLNGKNFKYGKLINAALYGICFAIASGEWIFLPVASGLLAIGRAPGWRQYISAMRQDDLNDHTVMWGIGMMSLRGIFFGGCLGLLGIACGGWLFFGSYLIIGALMGVVYYAPIRLNMNYNAVFNDWTIAEQLYGFILGLPLLIM